MKRYALKSDNGLFHNDVQKTDIFSTHGTTEKNQRIRKKTGAQSVVKEQYQEKWLQHVQRMDTNRLPKQALQYRPKRRRNSERPRKRWRDKLHLED